MFLPPSIPCWRLQSMLAGWPGSSLGFPTAVQPQSSHTGWGISLPPGGPGEQRGQGHIARSYPRDPPAGTDKKKETIRGRDQIFFKGLVNMNQWILVTFCTVCLFFFFMLPCRLAVSQLSSEQPAGLGRFPGTRLCGGEDRMSVLYAAPRYQPHGSTCRRVLWAWHV